MSQWKREWLIEVMDCIEDDYIAEAAGQKGIKIKRKPQRIARKQWMRVATIVAACLCVLAGGLCARHLWMSNSDRTLPQKEGIEIPVAQVDLDKKSGGASSQTPFVIYQGNVYRDFGGELQDNLPLENHLGDATGYLEEWTYGSEYVDFAGSLTGELYSLQGYDTSFAIALKYKGGKQTLLVRDNGITVESGAQIYEEWLHLTANCKKITYQNERQFLIDYRIREELPESAQDSIEQFIEALKSGDVVKAEDVPVREMAETWFLYFEKKDGMVVCMYCTSDGYVTYAGLSEVCVKVPEEILNNIIHNDEAADEEEINKESSQQYSEDAKMMPAKMIEDTETRMVLEAPEEIRSSNVVEKYYFENRGNPYVIYGVRENNALRFRKCSLSKDKQWVFEELESSHFLASLWEKEGEMYLEADSWGNLYAVTFDGEENRYPVAALILPDGSYMGLNLDEVYEKLDDGKIGVMGVDLINDDTLIFYRAQGESLSKITYHDYQIGIRFGIPSHSVLGEPENMHSQQHLAFDSNDKEHFYLLDFETSNILKRKYNDIVPEALIACEGLVGQYHSEDLLHMMPPVILNGTGYLATEEGIYRGSVDGDEWKLWVPEKDVYTARVTKGTPVEEIRSFTERFEFVAPVRGYGSGRELLMVSAKEVCKDSQDDVEERWILY